jgi:hypothetical protein
MKRIRRFLVGGGLTIAALAVFGLTWTMAQGRAKPAAPAALLPAGTVIYATCDGDALHQAAWEKTAAYDAFRKSGLIDALMKPIASALAQIPDERASSAMEIVEFVSQNGLSCSIGLPPGDGPALPYLTVIAHEAGPHGDVLDQFLDGIDPRV